MHLHNFFYYFSLEGKSGGLSNTDFTLKIFDSPAGFGVAGKCDIFRYTDEIPPITKRFSLFSVGKPKSMDDGGGRNNNFYDRKRQLAAGSA